MSAVMSLRKDLQEDFQKKHKIKLGFMSFFIKASVSSLLSQPAVNAGLIYEYYKYYFFFLVINGKEIIYRDYCDISIAVATPKGLLVPVIRNCESLSFAQIENVL